MIKIYVDSGNGVGIQTDNLRTADTECFRTKGAVNNTTGANAPVGFIVLGFLSE